MKFYLKKIKLIFSTIHNKTVTKKTPRFLVFITINNTKQKQKLCLKTVS